MKIFKLIKLAQIWKTEWEEDDIISIFKALYELEYKKTIITNNAFNAHPKRKENIINNIINELNQVAQIAQNKLLNVYSHWLENHALLSPKIWAEKRMNINYEDFDYSDEQTYIQEIFQQMAHEYVKYLNNGELPYNNIRLHDIVQQQMENQIKNNLREYKTVENFIKKYKKEIVNENISYFLQNIVYENFAEIKNILKQNFNDEDEAVEYLESLNEQQIQELNIENLNIDDEYIYDMFYDFQTLIQYITYYDESYIELLKEVYEKEVFPLWLQYWRSQGVEETREKLQNIYDRLKQTDPNDIGKLIANINIAINAAHQTGSMIDHIESYFGEFELSQELDNLTNGEYIEQWNKELKEIGVTI